MGGIFTPCVCLGDVLFTEGHWCWGNGEAAAFPGEIVSVGGGTRFADGAPELLLALRA